MLLIEGLSNAQGNLFCGETNVDDQTWKEREEAYLEKVNKIVSSSLLGSDGNDAQFKVPVFTKTGTQGLQIGTISMENYRTRKNNR